MNYQKLINQATNEVMAILSQKQPEPGKDFVRGKSIALLLANQDVDLEAYAAIFGQLAEQNSVKVTLPKWGRSFFSQSPLAKLKLNPNFIDLNSPINASQIQAEYYVIPVNNDNFLRQVGNLQKNTAVLTAIVKGLAMNQKVLLVKDPEFTPSKSLLEKVQKSGVQWLEVKDLIEVFAVKSKPTPFHQSNKVLPQVSIAKPHPSNPSSEESCYTCTTHDCVSRCLSKVEHIFHVGADRVAATLGNTDLPINLASFIDHTLLKPEVTNEEVRKLCEEARQYKFASVCVNPHHVKMSAELLKGSGVMVCTVIGFPLGATTSETKAYEARQAILNGAEEIDMVINVGALKSKDYSTVEADIRAVVQACNGTTLKVILETSLLNEEEKVIGCQLSQKAGADFVKTSTGFVSGGATAEDIALMRRTVGPDMGVKASGGVRDQITALKMLKAGATRIGASASIAIVQNKTSKSKGY